MINGYGSPAQTGLSCAEVFVGDGRSASLPGDACALGVEGDFGPDRIVRLVYDAAGEVLQEQRAVGTSIAQTYAAHAYSANGKEIAVADALGATHTTSYLYDGFDRLKKTTFADGTFLQNTTIDDDGNVKKLKTRAGENMVYTFDKIDRVLTKAVPATAASAANTVTLTYDLTNAVNVSDTNGNVVANAYDALGRVLTAAQTMPGMTGTKTVSYTYDDGMGDKINRSRVTWPDGYYVNYGYDAVSHMTSATDSDGIVLATQTYDNLARPATLQYPAANDNIATAFSSEDDLVTMTSNFAAAANDVSYTNSFTPAHQWASAGISNAAFRYVPTQTGSDVYGTVNALNQYAAMTPNGAGTQSLSYDTRGNLTGDGVLTLAYDPENRLVTASKSGMSAAYSKEGNVPFATIEFSQLARIIAGSALA